MAKYYLCVYYLNLTTCHCVLIKIGVAGLKAEGKFTETELEKRYFDIACKRTKYKYAQFKMFV